MIRSLFRKAVFVLAPLSCFALSAQQRDGQTDRDAVVIDYFFTARGVSPAYAERVRSVSGTMRRLFRRRGKAAEAPVPAALNAAEQTDSQTDAFTAEDAAPADSDCEK